MQFSGKIMKKIQTFAAAMTILFAFATAAHAHVDASPWSVNFGSESQGSTSVPRTVTITNENWHQITIVSIFTTTGQFSISGPSLPVTLDPEESLTVAVTFKPSAAQVYSGNLPLSV